MKRYHFFMVTVCVLFLLFSFFTITAKGQERNVLEKNREFYEQLEDSYEVRLREALTQKGYRNAGITMTKILGTDGSREYTVLIHHKRIRKMEVGERTLLQKELEAICFGDEQCIMVCNFLDCDK